MAVIADLRRQTYRNREIILVDNASSDDSADRIEATFPEVKVIKAKTNLGVPGGRNLGIESARGEIIFFLDNDAYLESDGLTKIIDAFRNKPGLGIISCHILHYGSNNMDFGSWVYPKAQLVNSSKCFITYSFCGCGFAVRKKVFEEAGLLQDGFFFCREEDEFSIRVLRLGYDIRYFGNIHVYHKTSPEGRYEGPERLTFCLQNLLLTIWAYYPLWPAITMTFFRLVVYLEKGRRAGSMMIVPRGLNGALRNRKRFKLGRQPMEKAMWKKYRQLNPNLDIHWWQVRRIREEFGDYYVEQYERSSNTIK